VIIQGFVVSALQVAGRAMLQAPFANEVLSALTDAERVAVTAIRAHLRELDPAFEPDTDAHPAELPASPTDMLHALLDRSMYSRPDESRNSLYLALLQGLLPDEARILAALSDGSAYPIIDVAEPVLGTSTAFVLTNASTVGRAAGVSLPHCTPLYIGRLVQAGLAAIGPEGGNSMYDDYEMLLTDAAVNLALTKARRGVRSARVIRRTVRITELGQEMWEAAK
jgi:hypothetical protein